MAGQDLASYLKTIHLEGDLGKRGARGAVVMLASQGLKVLLQIASTVVLARRVSPECPFHGFDVFGLSPPPSSAKDESVCGCDNR